MALSRTFRRITHGVTSVLLAIMVVVFLLVLLAQVTGRYRFVPVLSGSMDPFVETGDVAVLEPRPATDVAVGDVLAFEAPVNGAPLTLHRVIEVVSPAPELVVRTQGDANEVADPWLARLPGDTHWRATAHVDDIGTPVVFLNRARTRFLWLSVAAVLLAWWGFAAIWRDDDVDVGDVDDGDDDVEELLATSSTGQQSNLFVLPAVLLATILIVHVGGRAGADASFTDRTTGAQLVSSATGPAPEPTPAPTPITFDLKAEPVCDRFGTVTSVELRWTAPAERTPQFDLFRAADDMPYDSRVARVRGTVLSYTDSPPKASTQWRYFVETHHAPAQASNEVIVPVTCSAAR